MSNEQQKQLIFLVYAQCILCNEGRAVNYVYMTYCSKVVLYRYDLWLFIMHPVLCDVSKDSTDNGTTIQRKQSSKCCHKETPAFYDLALPGVLPLVKSSRQPLGAGTPMTAIDTDGWQQAGAGARGWRQWSLARLAVPVAGNRQEQRQAHLPHNISNSCFCWRTAGWYSGLWLVAVRYQVMWPGSSPFHATLLVELVLTQCLRGTQSTQLWTCRLQVVPRRPTFFMLGLYSLLSGCTSVDVHMDSLHFWHVM